MFKRIIEFFLSLPIRLVFFISPKTRAKFIAWKEKSDKEELRKEAEKTLIEAGVCSKHYTPFDRYTHRCFRCESEKREADLKKIEEAKKVLNGGI